MLHGELHNQAEHSLPQSLLQGCCDTSSVKNKTPRYLNSSTWLSPSLKGAIRRFLAERHGLRLWDTDTYTCLFKPDSTFSATDMKTPGNNRQLLLSGIITSVKEIMLSSEFVWIWSGKKPIHVGVDLNRESLLQLFFYFLKHCGIRMIFMFSTISEQIINVSGWKKWDIFMSVWNWVQLDWN